VEYSTGHLRAPKELTSYRRLVEHIAQSRADSLSGPNRPKALFLDAAGTFLTPAENVADVYLRYGRPAGISLAPEAVLHNFRRAYNEPWSGSLRYVGEARDFWRRIVFRSLCTRNEAIFEDIYNYYAKPEAWHVAPDIVDAVARIRSAGVKVAVVSNFDDRLRPLLVGLHLGEVFDAVIVSAEVGAEKPSPRIFAAACEATGVDPEHDNILHVGDDRRNDVWGARAIGIDAWLWGEDVTSFDEIADRIETGYMTLCPSVQDNNYVPADSLMSHSKMA
jgi:REG-2-like HAD superfamily hydrolase